MSFPDTLNLNYLIEELSSKHKAKTADTEATVIDTGTETSEQVNDDGNYSQPWFICLYDGSSLKAPSLTEISLKSFCILKFNAYSRLFCLFSNEIVIFFAAYKEQGPFPPLLRKSN